LIEVVGDGEVFLQRDLEAVNEDDGQQPVQGQQEDGEQQEVAHHPLLLAHVAQVRAGYPPGILAARGEKKITKIDQRTEQGKRS
jgi:hypothetical protein